MKKIFITFLALTGAVTLLINFFHVEFGNSNFWHNHGILFLICITLFPRLTLLFSNVPFGGLLWWLGFFIAPRFLISVLATIAYWQQNPILVVISWLITFGGESGEKFLLIKRKAFYSSPPKGEVLEAEFTRKN